MIREFAVDPRNPKSAFDALVQAWADDANKVFVLRAAGEIGNIRDFYDRHFPEIGTPVPLAEDVGLGDRDHQRTGQIWMEVRYDPKHPDAYRHSANAQPLHTDGSYIPAFPNATLMACVANAGDGGETTFIDAVDLVAAMDKEAPDLLRALQTQPMPHARSGDRRVEYAVSSNGAEMEVNFNFYCVDKLAGPGVQDLAQRFFDYLQSSRLVKEKTQPVKLMPGDAVTWKDRRVLHGRNGFKATMESERFLWKCALDVGKFG